MEIRKVILQDLDDVMQIIVESIERMRQEGSDQWDETYPTRNLFEQDILNGNLFGVYEHELLLGFACINEEQSPEYESFHWEAEE